ncbi:MAG: flagellar brake protein [Christensenellaceae bacterium]|jgi:c-di-GMP-binding flagellar brake protein YcgR
MGRNDMEPVVNIELGELLEIEQTGRPSVKTRVENIDGDTIWTMDFLREVFWDKDWKNQAYSARFIRRERCFAFLVSIEGVDKIDNLRMTRLTRISPIEEVQRRAAYRLQYLYDVYIRNLTEGGDDAPYIKCQGLDISEGGIGINAEIKWKVGDKVECKFDLDGDEYLFIAHIVRRLDSFVAGQYIYRIGLKFTDEDEKQLRRIRRFIFNQQIARPE